MSVEPATSVKENGEPKLVTIGLTKLKFSPVDLLKVLGGMVVLGGLALHLIGVATHDAYLREWGVDNALFPKAIDRVLIEGYEGLLVAALKLWPEVLENLTYLVLFAAGVSAYRTALGRLERRTGAMEVAPRWLSNRPPWVQSLFARFIFTLGVTVLAPIAVWLVSVLLALPVMLGEHNGKAHATAEREQFARGCKTATSTRCFDLKRGTELVGRGLLIDSSQEYIAFYDVPTSGVRVLSRQGLEVATSAAHP